MSIQVVLDDHDLVSFRQKVIDQVFHAMGKINLGSLFCHSDMTLTKQRHENHKEIARTVALVFVIVPLWTARFCWQRLALLDDQLNQMFIKANQRSYAASRAAGPEFFDELGPARALWRSRSLSRPLPWYAAEKATYGAFAAFVGLRVDAAARAWQSVAIGDCCLFQLDACKPALRLVRAFPLTRASQFGSTPFLLGTAEPSAADLAAHVEVCTGSLREDDVILLVSDALGAYLLRHEEESEPLWRRVAFELRAQDAFAAWVQEARENGMRNDDVTLVRLVFHGAAEQAGADPVGQGSVTAGAGEDGGDERDGELA